jgi:cell division protein ZipA
MDGLRWLLLLFGLLVIAGVYMYSRREKQPAEEKKGERARVEPRLERGAEDEPAAEFSATEFDDDEEDDSSDEQPLVSGPQKIVTVRIVAHDKKSFAGDELILSMRGIGLRHGKFGIFHRYDGNDEDRTVFSAASLVEPGSFDLQNIKGQEIPGISLFLVLPGPVECVEAFDLMLATARTLTKSLDGELLDESGSTLSIQRERYLREEIIQFQHSSLVS